MNICDAMKFRVTHVFREDNSCANRLVNLGVKNMIEFV